MSVRQSERREVRLTKDEDELLQEELAERGITFAAWVREQLELVGSSRARRQRLAAFEKLLREAQDRAESLEPLPEWEVLKEEMAARYDDLAPGS